MLQATISACTILTFNQSLSHEVIVHGLCNNLGYFITVKLHKSIAFTPTCLENKTWEKTTMVCHFISTLVADLALDFHFKGIAIQCFSDPLLWSFPILGCFCWQMGFITLPRWEVDDKLNMPHYFRHSCLTPDHWYTWDHFQSVPEVNLLCNENAALS